MTELFVTQIKCDRRGDIRRYDFRFKIEEAYLKDVNR